MKDLIKLMDIKLECKKQSSCEECKFSKYDGGCIFEDLPCDWKREELLKILYRKIKEEERECNRF